MQEKILYSINEVTSLILSDAAVLIDTGDAESFKVDHIAGAVNVHEIRTYLATSTGAGLAKMHENFKDVFSKAGLTRDKVAILYEDGWDTHCRTTCRGYWLLKYLGHPQVGILDCGFIAWTNKDLPVEEGEPNPAPAQFEIDPRPDIMATKDDVLNAIEDPSIVLLDTRDEQEWHGDVSTPKGYDPLPRKGRLPGAKWIKWDKFIDGSRNKLAFKSPQEIKRICAAYGIYPDNEIISYCFKGRRAANAYVALKQAGFTKQKVYFASYNEWARHPELPIEMDFSGYRSKVSHLADQRRRKLNGKEESQQSMRFRSY